MTLELVRNGKKGIKRDRQTQPEGNYESLKSLHSTSRRLSFLIRHPTDSLAGRQLNKKATAGGGLCDSRSSANNVAYPQGS